MSDTQDFKGGIFRAFVLAAAIILPQDAEAGPVVRAGGASARASTGAASAMARSSASRNAASSAARQQANHNAMRNNLILYTIITNNHTAGANAGNAVNENGAMHYFGLQENHGPVRYTKRDDPKGFSPLEYSFDR